MIPKVSIIIPCFNAEATIKETIESVLKQSYKSIEIVIVDDGSTDNTFELIRAYQNDFIKIFSQQNAGPSASRNYGASQARGKYLCFIDSDDKIYPEFIETCMDAYSENPKLEIVYTDAEFFEGKSGKWNLSEFSLKQFLVDNCIPIYPIIKKDTFLSLGGFDSHLKYTEDWELWIRIVKQGGGVKKINKILYQYRKHTGKNKSLTDLNEIENVSDKSRLYIYNKHYDFYKLNGLDISTLITSVNDNTKYKKKYYNTWYRKLIYTIFKPKKYKQLMGE
ncbi:glycosyltransferase [Riemerella anatipestifer]|uniref:glycosyltransferase family 2 protein n=1 Tax=Riemerella anatipestifer TaxID=34085 RepID=UPI001374C08E|nr:glycosyltransferase [Riemerella anatipestifer]